MSEIKMLPLPSVLLNWPHPTNHVAIRDYARAVAEHNVAARDAEIEALRAEVNTAKGQAEFYRTERNKNQRKAERMAEALRLVETAKDRGFGIDYAQGVAQSALRNHDQERNDG